MTIVARPEGVNPPQGEEKKKEGKSRNKKNLRCAGGQIWEDTSLGEWDHGEWWCVVVGVQAKQSDYFPTFLSTKL